MHLGRRRRPAARGGSPNSIRGSALSGAGSAVGSLTAAGFKVRHDDTEQLRRLIQPWQERAFAYYDRLGEVKYASQFYARMLAPLRLYVEKRDPATGEWNEIDDPKSAPEPTAALERIQDPGGGRESLLSSYGRLMFLAGEGYLLCTLDDDGLEQWEFLSTDELRIVGSVYMRYRSPSLNAEEYREPSDDDWEPIDDRHAVAYRLWRRHPRYCADDETEILTERGWMTCDELQPGIRVLTLNHESGLSEWQPVESVNRFSVEDETMISVEGAAHSSLTTMDHRWPTLHRRTATNEIERYWTTSERLNSCDQLITGVTCADLPVEESFSDDFIEAVAWFYTEGSIARRYRSAQVSISQSDDANPVYVGRIRSALAGTFGEATTERMSTGSGPLAPPKWREYREPNRGHVAFWLNTAASEELLAVAPDKVVSLDFIRALTREQLDLFIETSLAADGHGLLLTQKDARRLAAFELACILSGRSPHTYRLASGITMTNARARGSCLISSEGRPRGMKPQTVPYSGVVWCPTTKNGTWLARRKGTVYYTGNSMLADSTMMGVLDLCEELLLLTLAVRARARSRLASAGILLVSDAIDYPSVDPVGDEDAEEDPFLRDLTEAMTAPLQNEGSPSAVVPLVVRIADEVLEKSGGMKHIQLVDPTQLYPETGLRRECIERIAIGLDMPPEILLGMSDANHWTVWMIDEQTWKAHGQPVANQLVNDLNAAYFRPQIREDGVADWQDFRIGYDASAIVNHPDRAKDAKDLFNLEAISKATLRDAAGFTEDDAMPDDELAERIGIKVRDSSLAWDGIPSLKTGGIEPAPGEIVSATGDSAGDTAGPTTGADVEPGPPSDDAPPTATPDLTGSAALASKIVGASDLAILRAREAAGNRLRSLAKRDADLAALLDGVPARDVAWTLGHERARAFASATELVSCTGGLVRDALRLWGLKDRDVVDLIAERIEQHAARTLFDERPSPIPPQFRAWVTGVLEGK